MINAGKKKIQKQIASLYGAMIMGIVVGIGISIINTRLLGPQEYGDLKFLQNIFSFAATFSTLGIFFTGSHILAKETYSDMENIVTGNLLVFAAIISAILSLAIFFFSFFEEKLFDNNLGSTLRVFSPLLFVFPFQLCVENILQGTNRIYELSAFRLLPQILYMGLFVAYNFIVPMSLAAALAIQFITLGATIGMVTYYLKPDYGSRSKYLPLIWDENKRYGVHVYYGALAGVASAQLGGLAIGYYIDTASVGIYALALTITVPLAMVPNAIGTTFFRDFANFKEIPKNTIIMTLIISFSTLILFMLIVKELVVVFYSNKYIAVVPISYSIAVSSVLYGLGDFVNRFLGAHGRGVELRNCAIAVGISNVLGFVLLVKYFGLNGAAATKLMSGAIYLLGMCFYYWKFQNDKQSFAV